MKVELLAAAEADLAETVSYYNEQSEGLGYDSRQRSNRPLVAYSSSRMPGTLCRREPDAAARSASPTGLCTNSVATWSWWWPSCICVDILIHGSSGSTWGKSRRWGRIDRRRYRPRARSSRVPSRILRTADEPPRCPLPRGYEARFLRLMLTPPETGDAERPASSRSSRSLKLAALNRGSVRNTSPLSR